VLSEAQRTALIEAMKILGANVGAMK